MARLTPKSLFQKLNKDAAKALALAVEESWFQSATTAAMAQMAENSASAEQISGARAFLDTLCMLHLEAEPVIPFPDKSGLKLNEPPAESEVATET